MATQQLTADHGFGAIDESIESWTSKLARAGVLLFAGAMLVAAMGFRARLITLGSAERAAPQQELRPPAADDTVMPIGQLDSCKRRDELAPAASLRWQDDLCRP